VLGLPTHSCKGITSVADRASLLDQCLPNTRTMSCAAITAWQLEPSCNDQFYYDLSSVAPATACDDFATVWAYRAFQCGYNFDASYREFVATIPGGCAAITKVEDMDALYHTCFVTLRQAPCDALAENLATAACSRQLLY
jgi:hypothetical protein